jgi:type IV pilus assembly protein PilY1
MTHAQSGSIVLQDDFRKDRTTMEWLTFGGACLTAGSLSTASATNAFNVPTCTGGVNATGGGQTGTMPDFVGTGALRLTNATGNRNGAIITRNSFPANQGIAVTFSSIMHGGTGADGFTFFVTDAARTPSVGALGGSLGYTCSNGNTVRADGVIGGYIGLGLDAFGNFLNPGDNTNSGPGFQAGRIGIRGRGDTSWAWLRQNYPTLYPATLTAAQMNAAVRNTCRDGRLWNYSVPASATVTTTPVTFNYAFLTGSAVVLPAATPMWTTATTRATARPITYQLRITQNGLLSLAYSYNGGAYQQVLRDQDIRTRNGTLPSNVRFGFAASTGGSTNIHEIACFRAEAAQTSGSTAGINTQQTGQIRTGTQIYLAYYQSDNWWGQLTSQDLVYDPITDLVSIRPTANWDANCVLTGGTCIATGTPTTAISPTDRVIITSNGTQGVPFRWANLTATQRSALTAGDGTTTQARFDYIRGDRSLELTSTGTGRFRARNSVLGDIINSSPAFMGPPAAAYPDVWVSRINSSATFPENIGTATYSNFVNAFRTRLNVVWTGSNDGFLHGFRAGAYDASGNYVNNTTFPNDGREVLAYMPSETVLQIHTTTSGLSYSSPQYGHAFHLDATPSIGDIFYRGRWRTFLAGGQAAGGSTVFLLDVTDPSTYSEANAASLLVGEWTPSTISCVGNATCGTNMGLTYGQPAIRRFHNDQWGIVFGNGIGSSTGTAGIYVVLFDRTTGSPSVYYLGTGVGSSTSPNGIAFVTPVDLDGDRIVDFVYGGDLLGNVWRFNLNNSNPANWAVARYGNASATPLFTTPSSQPITTRISTPIVPTATGGQRLMLNFGTGRQFPLTLSSNTSYMTTTQALYGVWDWDMAAWNLSTSGIKLASLTGTQSITTSTLALQTATNILDVGTGQSTLRTVSRNRVCWRGTSECTTSNNQMGWRLPLPDLQEQVVFSPILSLGSFIVNTTVPSITTPLDCTAGLDSGWTLALNPATGGSFVDSFFSGNNTTNFLTFGGAVVSGVRLGAVGSPSVVTARSGRFLVNQTSTGRGDVRKINPPGGASGRRLTWQQLR